MEAFHTVITTRVPADHPSLAGHFPGRPVVPGAVTLSLVEEALALWLQEAVVMKSAPTIKFLRPVLPGQILDLAFRAAGSDRADFRVSAVGEILVEGRMVYSFVADAS